MNIQSPYPFQKRLPINSWIHSPHSARDFSKTPSEDFISDTTIFIVNSESHPNPYVSIGPSDVGAIWANALK